MTEMGVYTGQRTCDEDDERWVLDMLDLVTFQWSSRRDYRFQQQHHIGDKRRKEGQISLSKERIHTFRRAEVPR